MTQPKPRIALVETAKPELPAVAKTCFLNYVEDRDPYPRKRPLLLLGRWSRSVRRWFYGSNRGGWA